MPSFPALLRSDAFWRYVDAFVPRIFALGLHTLVVWRFGAAQYALAAWVAASCALAAAFVPDPHSYLFVRAHGPRATRLAALFTPYLWAKAVLSAALSCAAAHVLTSDALRDPVADQFGAVLVGAALYGMSEFLWTYSSAVGFTSERMRSVAVLGIIARLAGVAVAAFASWRWQPGIGVLVGLYAVPTLLACAWVQPWSFNVRRCALAQVHALKSYALWSQGVSLSSAVIAQLLPTGVGMLEGVKAADAGAIAYMTRMLAGLTMPFQVLQGLVVKNFTKFRDDRTPAMLRYRRVFRAGAVGCFALTSVAMATMAMHGELSVASAAAMAAYAAATAALTWNRFELSLRTSRGSIRPLFTRAYGPVAAVSVPACALAGVSLGLPGLVAASTVSCVLLALSWRRVPLR